MSRKPNRKKRTAKQARWQKIIADQGCSGQSVRAYTQVRGISEARFYWWRKELARRNGDALPAKRPDFAPVHVLPPAIPALEGMIEICLSSGARLRIGRGAEIEAAARLIPILEKRPC